MPIYEYRCGDCQSKFELLRSFSRADEPAACPGCGAERGRRLVSVFASFSKGANGEVSSVGGSGCGGCTATSCDTCH
jgi:putative FmdB family regulatory protein